DIAAAARSSAAAGDIAADSLHSPAEFAVGAAVEPVPAAAGSAPAAAASPKPAAAPSAVSAPAAAAAVRSAADRRAGHFDRLERELRQRRNRYRTWCPPLAGDGRSNKPENFAGWLTS